MVKNYTSLRSIVKKEMLGTSQELEKLKASGCATPEAIEALEQKIASLNAKQMAVKILVKVDESVVPVLVS